jgi:Galactose oxidase, central domain
MKKKQSKSMRASVVQITFPSLLVALLTLGAAPARNQFDRKPAGAAVALQNPRHRAAVSEPMDTSWVTTGSMGTARQYHTATLLQSGKMLVAGGVGTSGDLSSVELYDPSTGTWTATGSLGTARRNHTATLLS